MQHTVKVSAGSGTTLRERMKDAKSGQKSKTVDAATFRSYAGQRNTQEKSEDQSDSFEDNKTDNEDVD